MRELELKYPHLKDLQIDVDGPMFQFLSDPNDINRNNMPNHINYKGKTRPDKLTFSSTVTQQLQLRNIDSKGRLNMRVEGLREGLFEQEEYLTICNTIERYEQASAQRLLPIMWCIPCIMHLHNRVVEKIIFMLLKKDIASD